MIPYYLKLLKNSTSHNKASKEEHVKYGQSLISALKRWDIVDTYIWMYSYTNAGIELKKHFCG